MTDRERKRAALIRGVRDGVRTPAESYALAALLTLNHGACVSERGFHEGGKSPVSRLYCDACIFEALATAWDAGRRDL